MYIYGRLVFINYGKLVFYSSLLWKIYNLESFFYLFIFSVYWIYVISEIIMVSVLINRTNVLLRLMLFFFLLIPNENYITVKHLNCKVQKKWKKISSDSEAFFLNYMLFNHQKQGINVADSIRIWNALFRTKMYFAYFSRKRSTLSI